MRDLNSVIAEGNLVADPQSKSVGPSGRTVCSFTIAMNGYRKNKEGEEKQEQTETVFLDVECWATLADRCAQYLMKGKRVRVLGRLRQSTWVGKDDLKNHSRLYVLADQVEFGPGPKGERRDSYEDTETAST
ncbi:MAG: single-stranded DNA-binding protein [Sphaerochaetaceae bacterium]|nr:single-stranded DNA-binding protein [Spirochaetales bacterium]MDY5499774.1 single-stranded DNA-binding protein [Sphaerochaetaceae bacterium]